MFQGISSKRLLLYGLAAATLLVLNLMRLQSPPDGTMARQTTAPPTLQGMPPLHLDRDFAHEVELGTRDLFSRRPLPQPKKVEPLRKPVQVTVAPDPFEKAMAQARRELADLKLIGIMSAQEGSLAVLYHNGNTTNRAMGDEVVSGFTLDRITREDVLLSNQSVGISAILTIGGRKPMQLIRVE